jgi:thiamine pyrophosphokinase
MGKAKLVMEERVRAIIVAGGNVDHDMDIPSLFKDGDLVIGADGGAARALEWGLVPDLVVGDMDSLAADIQPVLEGRGSEFVIHPRAKDETDLELALTVAVERGAREIIVLGALGGRLDHTLANVLLLALPGLADTLVRIVDGDQQAQLVRDRETVTLAGTPGDIVSLLPLSDEVSGVTTTGLAWALQCDTLNFGFTRGVSNEMVAATANVSIEEGLLLVVHGSADGGVW